MIPGRLLELPARLVGCVFDFVFRPALHLHPDRAPPGYPYEPSGRDDPVLSRALLKAHGLDLAPDIDPRNAIHRAAMLPPEGIAFIARRLGLLGYAPRLKQLVRREELAAIESVVDAPAWSWLGSIERNDGVANGLPMLDGSAEAGFRRWSAISAQANRPVAEPAIADLPAAIDRMGWSVLESAVRSMRPGLAERLLFKLPKVPPSSPAVDPAEAKILFSSVYLSCIGDWDADWEPQWRPLMYGEVVPA